MSTKLFISDVQKRLNIPITVRSVPSFCVYHMATQLIRPSLILSLN